MPHLNLEKLLSASIGSTAASRLLELMKIPAALSACQDGRVTRLELSQAMNMVLFDRLTARVGEARAYLADVERDGEQVAFDHGAIRTVRWAHNGALPAGEAAFTRMLRPLGFAFGKEYPLPRLKMTGRSYYHLDAPDEVAQFFISELHPERFSGAFQEATTRTIGNSIDPLTPQAQTLLWELERDGSLALGDAGALLDVLVSCFARQHATPSLRDYEVLLAESAEMAWIATEGNTFNHATDRVADVAEVARRQQALGRSIKESVEVSRTGRVMQTAFRAQEVEREFHADGALVTRKVPGSFYEFITRHPYFDKDRGAWAVDLSFDAGNAQQIFKMTAAA